MKYKVGDKVMVRKDLVLGKKYGNFDCLKEHTIHCGEIFTIEEIDGCNCRLNNNIYWWSDEMLEDVESGVMMVKIYQDGNKVIAKKEGKFGIARCSPEDEFDIFVGAKLALERLEKQFKPYAWLKKGVKYYYPCVGLDDLYDCCTYTNDLYHKRMINRGIVFRTRDEAIEAAKKMLAVVKDGRIASLEEIMKGVYEIDDCLYNDDYANGYNAAISNVIDVINKVAGKSDGKE